MKRVYEIIRQLRGVSGSIAKKAILTDNIDNTLLKQFIFFTYEPTISFYQKKIAAPAMNMFAEKTDRVFDQDTMKEVVEILGGRKITGNAAISWLGELYDSLRDTITISHSDGHEEVIYWGRELLSMMIARDIGAGVSTTTFNKIWGDLITDPPYMRCSLPKHVDIELWPWEEGVDSEIKYDGMYADFFIYTNGRVVVRSRAGSLFPAEHFMDIAYDLQEMVTEYFMENFKREEYYVFSGEMEMRDKEGKILPREKGNGILNSILQTGEFKYEETPVYTVWDFVPGSKHEARRFNMSRKERRTHLANAFAVGEFENAKLAERKVCYSYEEALEHYDEVRLLKLEGTVIKHPAGIWEDTTSKYQVKVKEEKDVELKVVGYREGKKKYIGLIGSILFETSDGLLQVAVSGMSDDDRIKISANREEYMHQIGTVKSNGIMYSKKSGKKHSLFLPRLSKDDKKNILWRIDKKEADSFARVEQIFA